MQTSTANSFYLFMEGETLKSDNFSLNKPQPIEIKVPIEGRRRDLASHVVKVDSL